MRLVAAPRQGMPLLPHLAGQRCLDMHATLRRSELRARSGKGLARRRAEEAWLALHAEHGLPVHVLRLGGAHSSRPRRCLTALFPSACAAAMSEAEAACLTLRA